MADLHEEFPQLPIVDGAPGSTVPPIHLPLTPQGSDGSPLSVTRDAKGRLTGAAGVSTDAVAHRLTIEPVILTDKAQQYRYGASRITLFANNQAYFHLTIAVSPQRQTFGLSASNTARQFAYFVDYSTVDTTKHALVAAKSGTGGTFGADMHGTIALDVPSFSAVSSSVNLSLDQYFHQELTQLSYFAPLLKSEFDASYAEAAAFGFTLSSSPLALRTILGAAGVQGAGAHPRTEASTDNSGKVLGRAGAWGFFGAFGASPGCAALAGLAAPTGPFDLGIFALCELIAVEAGADASLWSDVASGEISASDFPAVIPTDPGEATTTGSPDSTSSGTDTTGTGTEPGSTGTDTGTDTTGSGTDTTGTGTEPGSTGTDTGGGGGCFVKGTVVATLHGLLPIEQVQISDEIYTYDLRAADAVTQRVVNIVKAHREDLLRVCFEAEEVRCTPAHRFYTGSWTPAKELKTGDRVLSLDGQWKEVLAIQRERQQGAVFNLIVDETHTYFVGQTALLVHNDKIETGDDQGGDSSSTDSPIP